MDNRSWEAGAAGVAPAVPAVPSVGYPTNGDPVTSSPATLPGAWWFHQIGEELRAVLAAAGVVPDASNTAQLLESIERLIDAQSGNYALDTGAANAYVVALSPAIAAYANGLTVRVKVVNTNTAAATLNAGGGVIPLVNNVGGALAAGDLTAGGVYATTYIASAGKFYVTTLVLSQAASAADAAAIAGGLGRGQTWQDLSASRAINVAYTNTTGKPIYVTMNATVSVTCMARILVDGVYVETGASVLAGGYTTCCGAIIPPGSTYTYCLTSGSPTVLLIKELR